MEINIKKKPYELIIIRVKKERRNIVCQRYFSIKKGDLSKVKTPDFAQTFYTCVSMVEKAIADASASFLLDNSYVYYSNDMASLSPTRYSAGDVIFIKSEEGFYEYVNGILRKITKDSQLWVFAPLGSTWNLNISLYYNHANGERQLLAESSIDVSKYPRKITSKIDLTGKLKYWEQSGSLIYNMLGMFYQCLSNKVKK